MQIYQICIKYAQNMPLHRVIDFNIANMQFICKLYAKNMLNMQSKYAKIKCRKNQKKYAKICRICISLYIGIFCIYMHFPLC